jgi:hypothetical protein
LAGAQPGFQDGGRLAIQFVRGDPIGMSQGDGLHGLAETFRQRGSQGAQRQGGLGTPGTVVEEQDLTRGLFHCQDAGLWG